MQENITHRIIMKLQSTDESHEMSHDEAMSIVWKFVNPNKYYHKEERKPFVWSVSSIGYGEFELVFARIHKKDVEHFATEIDGVKEFSTKYGGDYRVTGIEFLPDIDFKNSFIRLYSKSGCQCLCKKTDYANNRRRYWKMVDAEEDKPAFSKSIENALYGRAESFGIPCNRDDIKVCYVSRPDPVEYVDYKGGMIPTQFVAFRLDAPPEIQALAVYGGIGKEPSSGFGLVIPD